MLDWLQSLWTWVLYRSELTKFDHVVHDETQTPVWIDGCPVEIGDRVWIKECAYRPRWLWALLGMRVVTRSSDALWRVTSVGGGGEPWKVTRAGDDL